MGKVHIFKDNIDTDVIIPARYLNTSDPKELAAHCMEDIDADFAKRVKEGDVILAGRNFGCGSSREHAPISIKAAGVSCVIASSFARIFLRNSINVGLPVVELDTSLLEAKAGDDIVVDFEKGEVKNMANGKIIEFKPFPEFINGVIKSGGLMKHISKTKE
jgi:3-isopropylmalate/(R)-2-methylmalate dehydratase small subunit